MEIKFIKNDGNLMVNPEGRLDTNTAPELESFFNANIGDTDALVIDCEKLEYVSSAGLRVLLSAQKKMKNSMKLINVCESVMEVFEITGFVDVFVIE